jgi:hypothetical protein
LANRLDGRPAQILEDSGPDSEPITKIIREIVHLTPISADEISAAEDEPIEWRRVRDGNGSGILNEDTARPKR